MSSVEKQLIDSEDALAYVQSIINTVRDPLLVLDGKLQIVTASRAFCRVFQVTREETEGQAVYNLGNGQWDIPSLRQALEVILPQQASFDDFEVTHTFPSIGRRTMLLNARKLWRISNRAELILLALEDITERKAAAMYAELEKITNELKRSNADLENFVRVAGHDLRAPLNSIVQFSQLLERSAKAKLDSDELEYLRLISESGMRMSRLVSDLLDYATLQHLVHNERVSVLVNPAYQEALLNLTAAIHRNGAHIRCEIGDEVRVCAEHSVLVLLFQNLIGNALKYARPSGVPEIEVSVSSQDTNWKFAVLDNGIGIEERHQQHIFEPFRRLHGMDYPGSGIGLSICQRIVERARGKIWVESELGIGSAFYFLLPKPVPTIS